MARGGAMQTLVDLITSEVEQRLSGCQAQGNASENTVCLIEPLFRSRPRDNNFDHRIAYNGWLKNPKRVKLEAKLGSLASPRKPWASYFHLRISHQW